MKNVKKDRRPSIALEAPQVEQDATQSGVIFRFPDIRWASTQDFTLFNNYYNPKQLLLFDL